VKRKFGAIASFDAALYSNKARLAVGDHETATTAGCFEPFPHEIGACLIATRRLDGRVEDCPNSRRRPGMVLANILDAPLRDERDVPT
jgi:hypothetical protein